MLNPWNFLKNPFLRATENNFENAIKLSSWHKNALEANTVNPFIAALLALYLPLHILLEQAYTTWKSTGSNKTGLTDSLQLLLAQMTDHLDDWEPDITKVYKKKSSGYKALFPQGRKPFTNGTIENRIIAVGVLAQSLQGNPALDAVRILVETYWNQLKSARSLQQNAMAGVENNGTALIAAIKNAMVMQFRNYGKLMGEYGEEPETIAVYFDTETLLKPEQTIFNVSLPAGKTKKIVKRKLPANENVLRVTNTTDAEGEIYFTDGISSQPAPGTEPVKIPPQAIQIFTPAMAGYTEERRTLYARNTQPMPIHLEVVIQ